MKFIDTLCFVMVIKLAVFMGAPVLADHPNAGDVTLSSLIDEALKNNIEIKEAEKQYEASTNFRKQAIAPYLPQIALEGGFQENRFDNERSSGAFAYGQGKINLYRGGKDRAENNVRSKEEEFQKINLEKTRAQIARAISKKYYELLYLQEGIALKDEALKVNQSQRDLANKKKAAGYTSQADVLEFELRETTLNSDIHFLKRDESNIERELRRLLGRIEGPVIRVGGHLHRGTFTKNMEFLLSLATQERVDLKEAEKNVAISNLQYESNFGDYLPQVDLEAKYGKLASEERVYDEKHNSVVMLKVTIPLFSGLDTVYGRQAKASTVAKNEFTASRIRQDIKVRIENAVARLRSIEERLNIEEQNIERSKQYYEITLGEYKKGVKNSPDVAGATERLFDARLRNLEFRKDFYLTKIEIAEAVGISDQDLDK